MVNHSTLPQAPQNAPHDHGGIFALRELLIMDLDACPPDRCQSCWFAEQVHTLRGVAIRWDALRILERAS